MFFVSGFSSFICRCWQIVVMLMLAWHLVQHINVPCCELLPVSWSWWRWLSWRSRSCGTAEREWPSSWFPVDWRRHVTKHPDHVGRELDKIRWNFCSSSGQSSCELFAFLRNTMKLMFWILIGMFRFVSSSFRRGGIPEWQRLLMHGWKFPFRNFPYCPVPCASPWYSSVVKASRWRPPRCWSCDAQQRNSFNYRYTDSSQRTIRLDEMVRLDEIRWWDGHEM